MKLVVHCSDGSEPFSSTSATREEAASIATWFASSRPHDIITLTSPNATVRIQKQHVSWISEIR